MLINLRDAKNVVVVGGGTAGWFAAMTLRKIFAPAVEVRVVESPNVPVVGAGEGGLTNLVRALKDLQIPASEFMRETGATFKLGICFEGWRTGADDDRFYHLFAAPNSVETKLSQGGFFPLLCALHASGLPLHRYMPGFSKIAEGASQVEVSMMLSEGKSGLGASFHFDSDRLAKFLKKTAISRGVVCTQADVDDIELDERGDVTGVLFDGERLPAQLLVDASGLARIGIGKKHDVRWRSFSDYLLADRAMPFDLAHTEPNPGLVTRAIAMSAGWMWQAPLAERIGAGYVFSSAHLDADAAVAEVENKLGVKIEPQRVVSFEPGNFERVWVRNMIALGSSSGFAEPLEATSIGQMLEQLRNVERIIVETGGIVPQMTIDEFNRANCMSWDSIRDFLRMHYDGARTGLPFWQDVASSPIPDSYAELKQCFALRTPRLVDLARYTANDWQRMFHAIDWLLVGAPMGVVTQQAVRADLALLPPAMLEKVKEYLNNARTAKAGA